MTIDEFIGEVKCEMRKAASGASIDPQSVISFESLKVMRKFITDERLKILKAIRKYKPGSIYELARILKRNTKNVSDDVHYLEEIGLLEIEKSKDGRKKTTPHVNYDKMLLEIPV